ncbi:FGGY family carbohydrate kinase [[Clostridium] symbiosum]|uniref:gluconokinase n=1 Tax=Clostridium symbiosum TaxID=1512 RepID=UPI001D086A50|nr:FGGY family carbohydrate kinase [[Clostridium] symbiosum]MCB6609607.1 hypothetical protein [[Clostridium] symbiosum]MCB6933151.1 hypothetical protein [[Clostridium] symbiosum]
MKILVLESSTSSAKAMLYDTDKKQSFVRTRPYPGMFDNATVHNAQTVFEETLSVARELLDGRTDVDMISLGGTWHSLCLMDSEMNPMTPVLPWCYTGASGLCREIRQEQDYVRSYYHKTGCMVNAIYPFFKLRMFKNMGFDLSQYIAAGQNVYNTYRMTGRKAATECVASGTGLMNIYTKQYEPDLLRELGITEDSLPEIVPYDRIYPLTKEAASYLGLKEGTPVIPSNSDGGLNQIGVGALKKGVMTFSVGTSGAIRLTTSKPIIPDEPSTWCYLSPKSWMSGAATSGACNCIDWFKEKFAKAESYANLETGFNTDSESPVFLPFVFGERCPGWNDDRHGVFENLSASSTVQDLYRAVQEGVLFNLFQCYETLTAVNGVPEHIKLSGGILNSPRWTQMCADIFEKDMEVDKLAQSSLMGGVVLAMELAGEINSVEDFRVEPVSVIKPNPHRGEIYRKRYQNYLECYRTFIK